MLRAMRSLRTAGLLPLLLLNVALLVGCPKDEAAPKDARADEADENDRDETDKEEPEDAAPSDTDEAPPAEDEGDSASEDASELDAGEPAASDPANAQSEVDADAGAAAPSNADAASSQSPSDPSLAAVETVLGEMYSTIGVGGYPSFDGRVVVLLKDGWATRNTRVLFAPVDVVADRAANPGAYRQWKKFSNGLAEWNGKSWILYEYQDQYAPLPKGATLQGAFSRLTGGGNIGAGGDILIASQQAYNFGKDGTFARNVSGVVSSSSVTAANLPPKQHGTYEIDGYRLRLHYADGSGYTTSIVTTGTKLVFIAGLAYTR
jgi:hypothetical protein